MDRSRERNHQLVFWGILSFMLILRIPLESWTEYLLPSTSTWIEPLYEICTYVSIAFLIWWERERLSLYHLDYLAIIIIIIFKPLSTVILLINQDQDNPLVFPKIPSIMFFIIAGILLVLIFRKYIAIGVPDRKTILWFVIGCITGVALGSVETIILIKWFNYPTFGNPGLISQLNLIYFIAPIYQLGYAAVAEEPLFRGFLWGALRKLGIRDLWILLIQAILFTLGHIHLLRSNEPLLNLGMIFLGAVIFGLFVWRSRSLSSSMAVHGFFNGSFIVQVYLIWFIFH